jgi:WD40-like Beta Propeller Repeat
MKLRTCLVLFATVIGLGSLASQAEPKRNPLLLNLAGDLWTWDAGTFRRLTFWGHNGMPVLSPDGSRVAYTSTPKADTKPVDGVFVPGQNIYILDLNSLKAIRVAGDDAHGLQRSKPTWSPDGTMLAWTQSDDKLVTYSLRDQTRQVINATLRFQAGAPGADIGTPIWGKAGIGFLEYPASLGQNKFPMVLTVFAPTGKRTSEQVLPGEPYDAGDNLHRVLDGKHEWFALDSNRSTGTSNGASDDSILLFDPITGVLRKTPLRSLELFNSNAPSGLGLFASKRTLNSDSRWDYLWDLTGPKSATVPKSNLFNRENLVISSDGKSIASLKNPESYDLTFDLAWQFGHAGFKTLSLFENGQTRTLELPAKPVFGLAWAGNAWRVRAVR